MSVMKTFCGCVSTKTGSLAILGLYMVSLLIIISLTTIPCIVLQLLAIAEIVLSSLKIDGGKYGQIKEGFEMPGECLEADNNQTWWCKIIKNEDNSQY